MLLPDEKEFLEYVTENYSERKRPAKKEWTFQEYFNFVQKTLKICSLIFSTDTVLNTKILTWITTLCRSCIGGSSGSGKNGLTGNLNR